MKDLLKILFFLFLGGVLFVIGAVILFNGGFLMIWLGSFLCILGGYSFHKANKIDKEYKAERIARNAEKEIQKKNEEFKKTMNAIKVKEEKKNQSILKDRWERIRESSNSLHIEKEENGDNIKYKLCGDFAIMLNLCSVTITKNGKKISVIAEYNPDFPFQNNSKNENKEFIIDVPNAEYFIINESNKKSKDAEGHSFFEIGYFDGNKLLIDEIEKEKQAIKEEKRIEKIKLLKEKYGNIPKEERDKILSKWRYELKERQRKEKEEKEKAVLENKINGHFPFVKAKGIDENVYVYLMQNNLYKDKGVFKIGISNHPSHRERTLQSQEPDIELLKTKAYPSRERARNVESTLHKKFASKHLRGEWFELSDEDVDYVCEFLSETPNIDKLIDYDDILAQSLQ